MASFCAKPAVGRVEVERARALSIEPEPAKMSLEPAQSPSFLLFKNSRSSLLPAFLKIRSEPSSPLHLYGRNLTAMAAIKQLVGCELKATSDGLEPYWQLILL